MGDELKRIHMYADANKNMMANSIRAMHHQLAGQFANEVKQVHQRIANLEKGTKAAMSNLVGMKRSAMADIQKGFEDTHKRINAEVQGARRAFAETHKRIDAEVQGARRAFADTHKRIDGEVKRAEQVSLEPD